MNVLFTILTVLIVIAAVLLILVVLLQNGKGQGMASNFVAGNQTFGVRQTADILEKITWGLVAFIIVVSIIASFSTGSNGSGVDVTDRIENAASTEELPAFPTAPVDQTQDAPGPAPAFGETCATVLLPCGDGIVAPLWVLSLRGGRRNVPCFLR